MRQSQYGKGRKEKRGAWLHIHVFERSWAGLAFFFRSLYRFIGCLFSTAIITKGYTFKQLKATQFIGSNMSHHGALQMKPCASLPSFLVACSFHSNPWPFALLTNSVTCLSVESSTPHPLSPAPLSPSSTHLDNIGSCPSSRSTDTSPYPSTTLIPLFHITQYDPKIKTQTY